MKTQRDGARRPWPMGITTQCAQLAAQIAGSESSRPRSESARDCHCQRAYRRGSDPDPKTWGRRRAAGKQQDGSSTLVGPDRVGGWSGLVVGQDRCVMWRQRPPSSHQIFVRRTVYRVPN